MMIWIILALVATTYLVLFIWPPESVEAWLAAATMVVAALILIVLGIRFFGRVDETQFSMVQALLLALSSVAFFIGDFAILYHHIGIENTEAPKVAATATDCLYFSIVTWTTLGYGDFRPSEHARLIAGLEALIGYAAMVAAIGICGQYVARALKDANPSNR